jgi:hypothetical protein
MAFLHRCGPTALGLGLVLLSGPEASAQAFTPGKGLFSLTSLYQVVENTGHRMSDGYMLRDGQSTSTAALLEGEYAVSDRLAVTLGLPFIMARYHGKGPTPANLPVDQCRCWHSGFADFSGSVRYRLGQGATAFTPTLGFGVPSHAYNYQGEAVLGRRLKEVRLGASAATPLDFLPGLLVSATYSYAFVEKAEVDVPNNRSNAWVDLSYTFRERWFAHANVGWQRTHGGLRFGSIAPGTDLPFPGEVGLSGPKFEEHDRLLRDNHWKLGGTLGRSLGRVDLFAAFSMYIAGTDTHDGQSFTFGATWYFGGPGSPR